MMEWRAPAQSVADRRSCARRLRFPAVVAILVVLPIRGVAYTCDATEVVAGGTCQHPVRSVQECESAAARNASFPRGMVASEQAEEDRPPGCWVQVHHDSTISLYFNDQTSSMGCSPERRCICCATAAGSSPHTTVSTHSECDPVYVTSGPSSGGACANPIASVEQCTQAVVGQGGAMEQSASDRPGGCWVQPSTASLYFNKPPAHATPMYCSDIHSCVCCRTTTSTTTALCVLQVLTSGGGCSAPAGSREACDAMANQDSRVKRASLVAQSQEEDDRPAGCWWQPGVDDGSLPMLFFNEPPVGVGQSCSDTQQCMCCGGTTTTTTAWSIDCIPQLVATRAPFEQSYCPRPYHTAEACAAAAAAHPALQVLGLIVQSQSESDRPFGCWFQREKDHIAPALFFNAIGEADSKAACTDDRSCLCCGIGGQTMTAGVCHAGFVESGSIASQAACMRAVETPEECAIAVAQLVGTTPIVALQSKEGRPEGCWFQEGHVTSLFFNTPSTGAADCSSNHKCVCCLQTTTTTSTSTTSHQTETSSTLTTTSTTSVASSQVETSSTLMTTTTSTSTASQEVETSPTLTMTVSTSTPSTQTETSLTLTSTSISTLTSSSTLTSTRSANVTILRTERRPQQEDAENSTTSTKSSTTVLPAVIAPADDFVKSSTGQVAAVLLLLLLVLVCCVVGLIVCRRYALQQPRLDVADTSHVVAPESLSPWESPKGEKSPQVSVSSKHRGVLTQEAFAALCTSATGYLSCSEMHSFAVFKGFQGTEEEWYEEYLDICRFVQCDPAFGLNIAAFERLINDTTTDGCFCTNQDLQLLIEPGEQRSEAAFEKPSPPTITQPTKRQPLSKQAASKAFSWGLAAAPPMPSIAKSVLHSLGSKTDTNGASQDSDHAEFSL